ncbi:MAG: hypothetical protein WCA59_09670 [Candidatus Binataceae bacterium]
MDDDFLSQLNLDRAIAALIDGLTFDFGPDAASHVAALRKQALDELRQDPRFHSIAGGVYKATIALRQQRVDVARKAASNGITENLRALDLFLWDSRLVDHFTAELRQGEKLIEVKGFALVTNQRTRTRDELKRACRQVSEMNDIMFERNFTSDAAVHEVEARHSRQREISPGGPGMISNSDWRR